MTKEEAIKRYVKKFTDKSLIKIYKAGKTPEMIAEDILLRAYQAKQLHEGGNPFNLEPTGLKYFKTISVTPDAKKITDITF